MRFFFGPGLLVCALYAQTAFAKTTPWDVDKWIEAHPLEQVETLPNPLAQFVQKQLHLKRMQPLAAVSKVYAQRQVLRQVVVPDHGTLLVWRQRAQTQAPGTFMGLVQPGAAENTFASQTPAQLPRSETDFFNTMTTIATCDGVSVSGSSPTLGYGDLDGDQKPELVVVYKRNSQPHCYKAGVKERWVAVYELPGLRLKWGHLLSKHEWGMLPHLRWSTLMNEQERNTLSLTKTFVFSLESSTPVRLYSQQINLTHEECLRTMTKGCLGEKEAWRETFVLNNERWAKVAQRRKVNFWGYDLQDKLTTGAFEVVPNDKWRTWLEQKFPTPLEPLQQFLQTTHSTNLLPLRAWKGGFDAVAPTKASGSSTRFLVASQQGETVRFDEVVWKAGALHFIRTLPIAPPRGWRWSFSEDFFKQYNVSLRDVDHDESPEWVVTVLFSKGLQEGVFVSVWNPDGTQKWLHPLETPQCEWNFYDRTRSATDSFVLEGMERCGKKTSSRFFRLVAQTWQEMPAPEVANFQKEPVS